MKQKLYSSEDEFGPRPPPEINATCEVLAAVGAVAVILVEGWSDQAALQTLALRRGRDLSAEGISVVPTGGITNFDKFLEALGPHGLRLKLAGLCDAAEEAHVERVLRRLELGGVQTRDEREALGFFVCEADLEDELIRAVGPVEVERVLEVEGELESFRRFQEQPTQRGRTAHAQLRRFMGTRARRKIRYGSLLVDALSLDFVPRPLELVLGHPRT